MKRLLRSYHLTAQLLGSMHKMKNFWHSSSKDEKKWHVITLVTIKKWSVMMTAISASYWLLVSTGVRLLSVDVCFWWKRPTETNKKLLTHWDPNREAAWLLQSSLWAGKFDAANDATNTFFDKDVSFSLVSHFPFYFIFQPHPQNVALAFIYPWLSSSGWRCPHICSSGMSLWPGANRVVSPVPLLSSTCGAILA